MEISDLSMFLEQFLTLKTKYINYFKSFPYYITKDPFPFFEHRIKNIMIIENVKSFLDRHGLTFIDLLKITGYYQSKYPIHKFNELKKYFNEANEGNDSFILDFKKKLCNINENDFINYNKNFNRVIDKIVYEIYAKEKFIKVKIKEKNDIIYFKVDINCNPGESYENEFNVKKQFISDFIKSIGENINHKIILGDVYDLW